MRSWHSIKSPFGTWHTAGGNFSPAVLFALSEPGVWYDPSDLTTLFQDTAGTTPVTTAGQSVALALDKSKGLVLGSELVTNGDFSVDANWTKGAGWTISGGVATTASSGSGTLDQAISLTAGRAYRVEYTITGWVSGQAQLGFSGGTTVLGPLSGTGNGTRSIVIFAVTGNNTLRVFKNSSLDAFSIDNISVKELAGFHATQPTAASRPLYGVVPATGRRNLLTFTEQFDNAAWTKTAATVTANAATAPDGTTSADLLVVTTATNVHAVDDNTAWSAVSGTAYTASVSVKKPASNPARYFQITFGSAPFGSVQYATYDLDTGTVSGSAVGTASISDQGNGWFRCVFTASATGSGTGEVFFLLSNAATGRAPSYTGNGTDSILIWGAQLETGSTATAYQRVVSALDVTEAGVQSLSYLSFDGVDDFLVTPTISPNLATSDGATRRNLLTVPSMFEDTEWTKGGTTISVNTAVAPDGTTTADKMVEDGTTGVHRVLTNTGITVVSGSSYVWSVYAKAAERTVVRVSNNSLAGATFDLGNNGATSSVSGGITATATSVGSGWFRLSISTTAATTTERIVVQTVVGGATSYTGDGTSGILLWGAQLELGTTATAFQNIGFDKAQVFAGVRKLSDAATGTLLSSSDAASGSIELFAPINTGTTYQFRSRGTLTSTASVGSSFLAPISNVLAGLGDISGDTATLRVNGTQAAQSTADQGTGNFLAYPLYIGRRGGTTLPFNGNIFSLIVRFGANLDAGTIIDSETWVNIRTRAY